MRGFCKKGSLFVSYGLILCFAACFHSSDGKSARVTTGSSVDSFCRISGYPFRPLAVRYQITVHDNSGGMIPGPSDWKMSAIVRCDSLQMKAVRDSFVWPVNRAPEELRVDTTMIDSIFSSADFPNLQGKTTHNLMRKDVYRVNAKSNKGHAAMLAIVNDSVLIWEPVAY
jgi:hypothetical protein